ncbi:MAG TPA: putative sugar nucleotidyl transferase [Ignavibacteria bacterium]|nr:putative sugar nucleotidyl transferase [Ignavibacteria bacterium]
MRICLFEDSSVKNLFPLTCLRASFNVKCGVYTSFERIKLFIPKKTKIDFLCRSEIADITRETYSGFNVNQLSNDDYLFINGKAHFDKDVYKKIDKALDDNFFIADNNKVLFARISKDKIENLINNLSINNFILTPETFLNSGISTISDSPLHHFTISQLNYPWDTIKHFEHFVQPDLETLLKIFPKTTKTPKKVDFINPKNIRIGKKVKFSPNVVLDASEGSIIIDDNTNIESFVYIKGPVYIGKNCLLKSGLKLYGPSYIGEMCKIAGEIGESIFDSYVNKQHEGFVGHSYVSPFVNLGADTVTSDLKNNYSKLKLNFNGELIDTGMQFLGTIFGDHTKTGINTMLNTGTITGIFANIFGGGFPAKEIPSFSWYETGKENVKYDLDKGLETAKTVMYRRKVEMSSAYEDLVRSYY